MYEAGDSQKISGQEKSEEQRLAVPGRHFIVALAETARVRPVPRVSAKQRSRRKVTALGNAGSSTDALYATYHAAIEAMIEDAGAILNEIKMETAAEMQPGNKAALDEVEQRQPGSRAGSRGHFFVV